MLHDDGRVSLTVKASDIFIYLLLVKYTACVGDKELTYKEFRLCQTDVSVVIQHLAGVEINGKMPVHIYMG